MKLAAEKEIPVVHITSPWWITKGEVGQEVNVDGIHIHTNDGADNDAGKGPIKVPAGVTLVVDDPSFLKWDKGGNGLIFEVEEGGRIEGALDDNIIVIDDAHKSVSVKVSGDKGVTALVNTVAVADEEFIVNITLNDDVTFKTGLIIPENDVVNIDLNGKNISCENTNTAVGGITDSGSHERKTIFDVSKDAKLSMSNGSFVADKLQDNENTVYGVIGVDNGELVLDNVDLVAQSDYAIVPFGESKVTVTGGSITANDQNGKRGACLHTSGNKNSDKSIITLTDVELNAKKCIALYLAGKSDVSVTGCTINAPQGVELRAGKLNMSDTSINYTKRLPNELKKADAEKTGSTLESRGGALFITLYGNGYISGDDKVEVNLTNVTSKYTGNEESSAGKNVQDYGIYTDDDSKEESNGDFDLSTSNTNVVRYKGTN